KTYQPIEYEPNEADIDRYFEQLERDQAEEDLYAFHCALPEEPAPKQSNSIDGSVVISAEREATPSIASEIEAKPKLKSLTHAELKALVRSAPGDLVEGLIPEKSINIFVGNSGLGKTPLHAQMGLCIAAGL